MKSTFLPRLCLLAALAAGAALEPAFASEAVKPPQAVNIPMGGLSVTLFDQARAKGLLMISLNLALRDSSKKDAVMAKMPRLQDSYMQIVSQLASTTYRVDRPINIPGLTFRLQQATDKVLGAAIAKVAIGSAVTRRF